MEYHLVFLFLSSEFYSFSHKYLIHILLGLYLSISFWSFNVNVIEF